MRWIWIDRFEQFSSGQSAVAIKCVSLAEEHLHDLYPQFPIVPHSLIVEGMAQTAGLLVGEARQFKEKVVLAKIGKAVFHRLVRPGSVLRLSANVDNMSEAGASISGEVTCVRGEVGEPVADIQMMFSHADQNTTGLKLPADNFVFTPQFLSLLGGMLQGSSTGESAGARLDFPLSRQ